ncbi:MAG: EF-hand domain-containing protein [Sphingomonadaceae bacterium]
MKTFLMGAAVAMLGSSAMAQVMDPAPSPAAPPAAPADARAIVASEFPSYDKDSDGALSKAEFDGWMTAIRERSGETPMAEKEQNAWLKGAFATADADKSKSVSQDELTTFLTAKG